MPADPAAGSVVTFETRYKDVPRQWRGVVLGNVQHGHSKRLGPTITLPDAWLVAVEGEAEAWWTMLVQASQITSVETPHV